MLSFTYGLPESALDTVEGVTPRATAISLIVVADIVKNKSWKHPGFQDKYKTVKSEGDRNATDDYHTWTYG